jgi:hypothetical protein
MADYCEAPFRKHRSGMTISAFSVESKRHEFAGLRRLVGYLFELAFGFL